MSIKDLFGKKSNKIVTKQQADKLADEVESYDYISETNKGKRKFIPKVDYSEPKNFAKYGSAEKYYEDTIEHIYGSYPYDGSDAEKNKWHRESSPLDAYILEKRYPKTVGHLYLNSVAGASNIISEPAAGIFTKYLRPQYIFIKGGPNKDSRVEEGQDYELSKQFPPKGGRANIWDEDVYRASNLGINPDIGNSVELWYKLKDDSIISAGKSFCLFDLWNGQEHASSSYVRLLVEVLPASGNDFSITYKYGSGAEGVERAGLNISAATKAKLGSSFLENWNHYSFTMKSTAAGIVVNLYVNGILEDTVTAGNQITSEVPQENYVALINAYNTKPLTTSPDGLTLGTGGAPNLYIDEFRFWKAERDGRQVGRNWFTCVSGGTNTDNSKYSTTDNVDIGVYYKFNEGIINETEPTAQDAVTLDYSGRISNGQIHNYSIGTRLLTSAIDESLLLDEKELPDPIIYSNHPEVIRLLSDLQLKGKTYDNINNASFYHTMPEWILQEDEDHSLKIKELSQALSSYFDTLHLQIEALPELRNNEYQSLVGKAEKPYYFAKSLLRSSGFDVSDIFNEATILEEIASRGETELFDLKIQEVKNVIYQNIYNNITHIYKTKGTEKSFRNLLRCFGIDDELVKINLYADGVDYTLEGRRSFTSVKKNYADFNNVDRHESIVYLNDETPSSSDERSFLKGPTEAQSKLLKTTLTAEVIFPKQLERDHPAFKAKLFSEISLFGTKEANVVGGVLQNHVETADNIGSFRVFAIKPDPESLNAKFRLVYTDADGDHTLETEEYKEVYDNTKWNIAVRLQPVDAELGDHVSGTTVGEYRLDFYGVSTTLDTIEEEFKLTAPYIGADVAKAQAMVASDKLCYVGALRTDLADESTEVAKSDVKVTDLMYWFDYLTDEELRIHAIDASNVGRLYPSDEAYSFFSELSDGTTTDIRVPRKDTLALHWSFQNVSSSDASGNFVVNDVSYGGAEYISEARYGWFTELVGYRHQGKGAFKPALPNDKQVVNREYQYTARHRLPEVLSGDDMIEIRTQDDDVFVKGSKPINHFFAIEKSMSQVISMEMLSLFASIVEFNDLIGQPVNRYRMQYKSLEKFRSLFYERVENVPSFEKYVEFYKWIDSSLGLMLQQLIPASGNFSESMRNMVENHILERSKYWTKFPTLEKKQDPPEGTIRGVRELTYDWEHGHAPLSATVGTPISSKAIFFDASDAANNHRILIEDSVHKFRFTEDVNPDSEGVPIPSGDTPFSLSAWIKVRAYPSGTATGASHGVILSKFEWDTAPPQKYGFATLGTKEWFFSIQNNGHMGLFLYDNNSNSASQLRRRTTASTVAVPTPAVPLDTWVHVVATYGTEFIAPGIGDPINFNGVPQTEFTDINLYVNAVNVGGFEQVTGDEFDDTGDDGIRNTGDANEGDLIIDILKERYQAMSGMKGGLPADDDAEVVIGNVSLSNWSFDGEMADVVIYNKELSASEVSEIYNNGSVKDMSSFSDYSSVLGWWKMGDDLDGGTVVKNYASPCDEHNGILINGPAIVDVDLADLPSDIIYDNDENCLWRSERAERSDPLVTSGDVDVDADRESIRNAVVRDVLGQTKMVKVGTELVEQGKPTLYNVDTSNTYEGSTYATRRLSRPYKLNIDKRSSVTGGPNFSDSLLASPNDTIRAATEVGHHIELDYFKSVKDAEVCNDDYGHKTQKRRAQKIKLINNAGVVTELKGSLVYNSLYGSYPNDTNAEYQNFHHDSYGQDHEVPVQGPFTNQWVGGNQHRHINLNVGSDNEDNRAELYKTLICDSPTAIKHPYDVTGSSSPSGIYPAARYTRDGLAKRPMNVSNIKSSPEQIKLGNYTYDYEIVQTSGRSNNNRWLTRNPDTTPDNIVSTYVDGLHDYTLPVRGRTEHVFVERFSAPGSPSTMSRGSLDYQAEEFSPYNSLNFRNLRVRNHLNFWHKEHSKQFGYREDYIHGTPDDAIGATSNDFGGNTPRVASWHKNNRNAAIRMKMQGDNVYAERSYDNFFISHQIPRSSWQYNWISASAVQPDYAGLVVIDDEHRDVVTATTFPYDHDGDALTAVLDVHPRYRGYITEYPNATIDLSGEQGLLRSASYASMDIDFSYGNTVVAELVDYDTQTVGSVCGSCITNFTKTYLPSLGVANEDNFLNAILINRNGPYQGAGWKFIRNEQNPIVRRQRRRNEISIQQQNNSASHEKFIEPPAAWNKPFYHIVSEEKDGVGTRVKHSYSNNLEGFANPSLTKRTGLVKRNEQFYDKLFDYYNPKSISGQVYDFVGLSYKEYIFPKHRNVGLHKIRNRIFWDRLTPYEIAETATGDLRRFWKDEKLDRIKSYASTARSVKFSACNALGYKRHQFAESYLNLDDDISEHLNYDRSIFSMDAFEIEYNLRDGQKQVVKYLGDLQYVGKEAYFSYILATNTDFQEGIATRPVENTPSPLLTQKIQIIEDALTGPYGTLQQNEDIIYADSGDIYFKKKALEHVFGTEKAQSEFDPDGLFVAGGIGGFDFRRVAPPYLTAELIPFEISQFIAPEPVVQLYYNPFNAKYEEDAWLYRSNVISGKSPWYNSYADFNLETRAMAQNYGLVAEFKISEHMNKYLFEDSGEFRSKNYNIFSLEGSAYNGQDTAEETRYSGKKRYKFETQYHATPFRQSVIEVGYESEKLFGDKPTEKDKALLKNNAYDRGLYSRYDKENGIKSGGTLTIKNSLPVSFGENSGIFPSYKKSGEVSWANLSSDATGTGRHRYFASGIDLIAENSDYKNMVYRESSSYEQWRPIVPTSYGPLSSLRFNTEPDSDDYMVGSITKVSSGSEFNFLANMGQTDAAKPEYTSATPFTFSLWARPQGEACDTADEAETYEGGIKGLITFGTYEKRNIGGDVRAREHLTVYSNFPPPEFSTTSLVSKYKDGMGLTVYVPTIDDTVANRTRRQINLFHFFDSEGNPLVLPAEKWSHVAVQVMPAIFGISPMKIKLYFNGKVAYGIHRDLLEDENYENRAYTCVPIERGTDMPWGLSRVGSFQKTGPRTTKYKLGKSRFANRDENPAYVPPIDSLSSEAGSQYYFSGELMEFSLWQGVLSKTDIVRISSTMPTNLLEEFLNGEILGGYTSDSKAQADWGTTSDQKVLTDVGELVVSPNTIDYDPTAIGLSLSVTRSKVALLAWHRLGVNPVLKTISDCDDWDDAFFDSYVHTDPIRFYDNVVEDHDAITNTARKRIRMRVNALKKLVPYRGFYPQDRTLQLAKLFSDKMKKSISSPTSFHDEQALQAALQPFFAPGILYNSIKAGVAVDWPAFTNETGLEPSNVKQRKVAERAGEEVEMYLTSAAPNWYVRRQDAYNAVLAMSDVESDIVGSDGRKPADAMIEDSYNQLKEQQPKYFAGELSEASKKGYVILDEPNTRIPFEGLVALDSVLPSPEQDTELESRAGINLFKHFDLQLTGWDAEGTEITLTQPEPIAGYSSPDDYISAKTVNRNNIKMVKKTITIGDPSIIDASFDVNVDFRRAPLGWAFAGSEYASDDACTITDLNRELAVKICREINKRPDIHFVAVPGYLGPRWERAELFDFEDEKTDDHLATLMPVAHPELFGIEFNEPEGVMQPYDRILEFENMGSTQFKTYESPYKNVVGDQENGTWKIRLIYVGLPKLELDLTSVDVSDTSWAPYGWNKLSAKPYNGQEFWDDNPSDISTWDSVCFGSDSANPEIYTLLVGTNWKETHLMSPLIYNDDPFPTNPRLNTYWNVTKSQGESVSGIPYSFFDGGGWIIDIENDVTLGSMCSVSIQRQTSLLSESKWAAGYGWFGFPVYSKMDNMGVRFIKEDGTVAPRSFGIDADGGVGGGPELIPQQGPYSLYGGITERTAISLLSVESEPHKMYLMAPEYYVENSFQDGDVSKASVSYKYPYFEYQGSDGDMRFEMAMHNFLAEVPNFFLRQGKLTSFVSKKEQDFKTMEAGKTYYMDVSMYKSDNFSTTMSPWTNTNGTMEGRYYGPAFKWQSNEDYEKAPDLDRALVGDPAQAPYVPPYLYGKSIARLYFECQETKKYSLEEILAGVQVVNTSKEQLQKFMDAGASPMGALTSPAWLARTTISSSMNLFGKATAKILEYSAQVDKLTDTVNEEEQKFVPLSATDPSSSDNDVWTIGTKFECPILNFYSVENEMSKVIMPIPGLNELGSFVGRAPELTEQNISRGTGIWAGYGTIPSTDEGVFVTIEDTFKNVDSFGKPKAANTGSLIDVCGFKREKKKIGELAEQKEISEAVVMIPFVDTPSETTAETVRVDGRNFFKINKDIFNLQKANIENGKNAVSAGEYLGVEQDIPETSISTMIKGMKKYNLPPRYDFVRYPLKKSESPFVMYIFEFHHLLSREDLSNIWQGLPPALANTAMHDSATLVHDLSPIDFFEENTLPKNVRWMVFKVKKKAKSNYFATTSDSGDDKRFEFNFQFGKKPPEYNYNWPYDFFTMLEAVQVEAGLDILENKMVAVPQVVSNQGELSSANQKGQIAAVKGEDK